MNRREFLGAWVAISTLAGCGLLEDVVDDLPLGDFQIPDLSDLNLDGALLTFDGDGAVYLLMPEEHAIARLSAVGAEVWRFGDPADPSGFNYPVAAAHDDNGNMYVVQRGGDRLTILGPDGTVQRQIGAPGTDVGQLSGPADALVHSSGELFVVDAHNHRVQVFGLDGTVTRAFGDPGVEAGQLNHPVAIAEDKDGDVHVVDHGNRRVQVYSADGALARTYGADVLVAPRSIAIDPLGNSYVADPVAGRVQVFTPDGSALRAFEGLKLDGVDAVPLNVAFSKDGALYVRLYAPVV